MEMDPSNLSKAKSSEWRDIRLWIQGRIELFMNDKISVEVNDQWSAALRDWIREGLTEREAMLGLRTKIINRRPTPQICRGDSENV
jgi:hypothetical protein